MNNSASIIGGFVNMLWIHITSLCEVT